MKRVWRNHGLRLLAVSAVLALMALMALCLVLLIRTNQTQEFKEQTTKNCQQINLLKASVRAAIDESQRVAMERQSLDGDQRRFIVEYYARQRARFNPDECP